VSSDAIYQAHSGQLPSTFTGSQLIKSESKLNESLHPIVVIREVRPGEHIEIDLKHVATTVSVRAVGKSYYSVSIAMPNQIVLKSHRVSSVVQLCLYLCPQQQRINIYDDQPTLWTSPPAHITWPSVFDAINMCTRKRLHSSAIFYDACVFDILTTGDLNATFAAEYAAVDADRFSRSVGFSASQNSAQSSMIMESRSVFALLMKMSLLSMSLSDILSLSNYIKADTQTV